jgi:hypothetical protein
MKIDALASEPHYFDHILPVLDALPPKMRGDIQRGGKLARGNPVIVASYGDAWRARQRQVIYMEHGIGQTYRTGHPAYAGGTGKDAVALFLSPSERVAELNRQRYPKAAQAVIGCPLIDRWLGHRPHNRKPVVAFAWHWDGGVAREARSAFRHYADFLPSLPFKLLGHGHPRAMRRLRPFYVQHDIEVAESFAEVLERANVLVFDNTSAGYMFAATGRPVVVLDAPWYRNTWGGRFWDWADVGVRIGEPARLEWAIDEALADRPEQRQRREDISADIFGPLDGKATQRAVTAITDWAAEGLAVAA